MRAKTKIFHLECFKCAECKKQLKQGDEFSLRNDRIFCREDSQAFLENNRRSEENNNDDAVTQVAKKEEELEEEEEEDVMEEEDDEEEIDKCENGKLRLLHSMYSGTHSSEYLFLKK